MHDVADPVSRSAGEWDFYADFAAVSDYIGHRDGGTSRNSLVEEPEFLALLGDVSGRRCLDLGCGYGHYAEVMARSGASVVGVDRSELMISAARVRHPDSRVAYHRADMVAVRFPEGSFDVVASNLAFHYLPEIGPLFNRIAGWLAVGGRFVFSVEHPILTASRGEQLWCDEGDRRHWVVSDYFDELDRWGMFGRKYHHTVATWLNAALDAGFRIVRVAEPRPSPAAVTMHADLVEDLDRPLFLVVSCVKREGDAG